LSRFGRDHVRDHSVDLAWCRPHVLYA
jgi:hypothetical protein